MWKVSLNEAVKFHIKISNGCWKKRQKTEWVQKVRQTTNHQKFFAVFSATIWYFIL